MVDEQGESPLPWLKNELYKQYVLLLIVFVGSFAYGPLLIMAFTNTHPEPHRHYGAMIIALLGLCAILYGIWRILKKILLLKANINSENEK